MTIKYLKHQEIDKHKWDSCIHYALNGNVYAYSWYLDNVTKEWAGLVEGDYESVFPLIWNDKLLVYSQLYQPLLCQQLGLFSVRILSAPRISAFLKAIPREFRYINFDLNYANPLPKGSGFQVQERCNLELLLNRPYETIRKEYSTNLKRSLKKAMNANLRLTSNLKPEKLVDLFKTWQGEKVKANDERIYFAHLRIMYNALHRGMGFLSGIEDENGELCAGNFFISSHGRIINAFPASTPKGRENCAMHLLLDTLIRGNAGKPVLLDFEGSDLPGVARFYKSFGAVARPYYKVIRNELPWWLKWWKERS